MLLSTCSIAVQAEGLRRLLKAGPDQGRAGCGASGRARVGFLARICGRRFPQGGPFRNFEYAHAILRYYPVDSVSEAVRALVTACHWSTSPLTLS
jgi:hypothetical protein